MRPTSPPYLACTLHLISSLRRLLLPAQNLLLDINFKLKDKAL
jgi:hypothetical protein